MWVIASFKTFEGYMVQIRNLFYYTIVAEIHSKQ